MTKIDQNTPAVEPMRDDIANGNRPHLTGDER
jgi:hypothetical protein